jgi:hypothetical protein
LLAQRSALSLGHRAFYRFVDSFLEQILCLPVKLDYFGSPITVPMDSRDKKQPEFYRINFWKN